jgi:hypothetical protein
MQCILDTELQVPEEQQQVTESKIVFEKLVS